MLAFDDILDLVHRSWCNLSDTLDMFRHENELMGIDMARFDEAACLLWAATGVVRVHKPALVIHEIVKVATHTGQTLAEIVGGHFEHVAANAVAGAEDLAKSEDKPLL